MTRPYSLAFKQKMIERLTGKEPLSASQLSRETGVRQQNLSRWLQEARSLPLVSSRDVTERTFTLEEKARVLADAANLRGEELHAYLEREGVKLGDFERWRIALQEDGRSSIATSRRIPPARARTSAQGEGLSRNGRAPGAKKNDREAAPRRGRRHRRAERELILNAIGKARSGGARLRQAGMPDRRDFRSHC